MKLILFCMNPEGSPYFASFKFAKQLAENNFRVIYAGFRFFEPMVLMQDLEYLSVDDNQFREDHVSAQDKSNFSGITTANQRFVATDKQINGTFCRFMENWLAGNKPDLVIIDNIRLLEFSIPFHKWKIPVIGFGSNLSSSFSLKYPPVTSHMAYTSSLPMAAASRNLLEWTRLYVNDCPKHLVKWLKVGLFVKKYGGRYEWGEYGYKLKVPNIIAMVPDFNLPGIPASDMDCFIGASVDMERIDRRPLPLPPSGKKLIYCSLGTHKYVNARHLVNFFNAVIMAVLERPHLQLILHVRAEHQNLLVDTSGNEDITILNWVPQLNVLCRSAVFITHGGLGSVRESIFLGVPMIVFPLAVDQPGNAARVLYHHLGVRGNIRKVDARSIGAMIDQLINDPSYAEAAKRMRRTCLEKEDGESGIRFINKIIAAGARKESSY